MLTTYQARAANVRALSGAVVFGSLVGLLIGAAYLGGVGARQSVDRSSAQTRSAELSSPPPQLRTPQAMYGPVLRSGEVGPDATVVPAGYATVVPAGYTSVQANLASTLRDRFKLALAITRSVAQPFHFADHADHAGDTHCLAQAVYYEARGESPSGQAAVAQVVLNRVRHPAFPKTVCGVVYQRSGQGCQFSFACNGSMHAALEPQAWRRAEMVAERALGGAVMSDIGEATQFHASGSSGGWASGLLKVAQIGEHVFYRLAGRAGSSAMFHQRPEPSLGATDDAQGSTVVASIQARLDPPKLIQTAQSVEPPTVAPQTPVSLVQIASKPAAPASTSASPPSTPAVKPDEAAPKPAVVAGL